MNDTKHTPTPWIATRGASEHPYSIEGATKTVAYIKMQIEPITTDANARFIVRACNNFDLTLEALRAIISISHTKSEQYKIATEALNEIKRENMP